MDTRLDNLIKLLEDSPSRDEFIKATEQILAIVKQDRDLHGKAIDAMQAAHQSMIVGQESRHEMALSDMKSQVDHVFVRERVDAMRSEHDGRMAAVDQKLGSIRNGNDGEPGAPGEKGDKGEDGSPDTPEEVRDKLQSLQGDERLDVSAIKGFDKAVLSHVQRNGTNFVISRGEVKAYDLSDQLNGSTKTFTLPAFWRVLQVNLSSVPNILRPTTDFTTDGAAMTLTFTSQISASTSLAAGQTCIILYQAP